VVHLVGVRRPVDAAVGHAAGRKPGATAASETAGLTSTPGCVADDLVEVDVVVELLELVGARQAGRLLERVGERARTGSSVGANSGPFAFRPFPAFTGSCPLRGGARARWRFRFAHDSPVLACRLVEPLELAVGDPQQPGVEVVERSEVGLAEDRAPDRLQRGERLRLDDPVVGARLQVHVRARGEVPAHTGTEHASEQLLGESGQDHVNYRGLQRAADEPAAQRVGRELAHAVRLHPRLLEQPPVDGELPVVRVLGFGQGDVVLDRPALGVLGVERLVKRDPEAA
jgi:hypothetical protein